MHTALAIAAGLLVGLAGWRYGSALRAEAKRLERWTEILDRLKLILGERSCSMADALRLAGDGQSSPDVLMHRLADGLQADPLLPLWEHFDRLCDDCAEKDDLLRMLSHLGRGSLEGRLLAVDQAAQAMQQRQRAASGRSARDAALWHRLGWIAGACLTLMLI